jgi:guanosine-3',5'-bis(diphosphate) 3'-pyrophosphohydrolase
MSLPKSERRERQVEDAPHKSDGAKLIKIADKISNIRARVAPEPSPQVREDLADYLRFAERVVAGCRGVSKALDQLFDDTAALARSML